MELFAENENNSTLFAELLLPVPVPKYFTYRVPQVFNERIMTGTRAIVQFGDRRILTGIVMQIHAEPPREYEAKYILELLDDFPVINEQQLQFFHWIASYYMCTPGEVLNAALPSGLKLSSESMVQLRPDFSMEDSDLPFSEKEMILLNRLKHETLTYSEISKLLGVKHLYPILKSLVSKEAIILFEEVKEKYRPKTEKKVRLTQAYIDAGKMEELFASLASKPKQEDVLLKYLQHVPVLNNPAANTAGLSKKILDDAQVSAASLQTLIRSGVLEEFEVIVSRFETSPADDGAVIPLSEHQQKAQYEILNQFKTQETVLLHGITGSGKTEVYISLIRQALESGTQALYLLPEIALTTQIVQRLKKVFGNAMGVYHSKFSDNERVEVWKGLLTGQFKFIVGVRSSIFLPFDNLGLIIVDEEHDPSYKQQEPAPRYHARDAALVLAQQHHAKVLLGSATPSIETYYHAVSGKYGLVKLTQRYGEAQLPAIQLADMSRERKQKTVKGEFSATLLKSIHDTLQKKEQVIIFQNRRGYSPMMTCEDCGWVPKCVNCAVSLTYHSFRNALVCHYCGYKEPVPSSCPTCTSTRLKTVGYGTEKLEEELALHFPETQVQRMDLDTTRSKTGYEQIIQAFEKGETQILVGTQMVTKGLDFDRVSLVGIFNADRMIHFPDFRAHERAYQLITQVSGRAGRREQPGLVIVQTSAPEHPLLQIILKHNFDVFFNREIADRQRHLYPPFSRLIEITVKHTDPKTVRQAAIALAEQLRKELPAITVMGPGQPMIAKIRNLYQQFILLKIARGKTDLAALKDAVGKNIHTLLQEKAYRNTRIVADVDPA